MNVRRWLAVGVVCSCSVLSAWSQDKKEGDAKPPAMPEMSAEDKAWMESMALGDNHKLLNHFVGNWDVKSTMWMGPEPTVGKAKASSSAILDGRYVVDEYHGEMMGMPFEGRGLSGYDNVKKKFVSTWVDNMGTGIFMHEGAYDPAKKEFTYVGEFPTPLGGTIKSRMTIVLDSPDQHTMTMYHTEKDKPEQKIMELVYTRTAGGGK